METAKAKTPRQEAGTVGDATGLGLGGTQSTLVKYDTPYLIATHERKKVRLPHDLSNRYPDPDI